MEEQIEVAGVKIMLRKECSKGKIFFIDTELLIERQQDKFQKWLNDYKNEIIKKTEEA